MKMKEDTKAFWVISWEVLKDSCKWPSKRLSKLWGIVSSEHIPLTQKPERIMSWAGTSFLDVLVWLFIVFLVFPLAFLGEWYARRILVVGKMYEVGAFRFHIPLPDGAESVFDIDEEVPLVGYDVPENPLYESFDDRNKRLIKLKTGQIIILTEEPEEDETMFGLHGKWLFLHPEGRMVELTFASNRDVLYSLRRADRRKRKKKKKKTK